MDNISPISRLQMIRAAALAEVERELRAAHLRVLDQALEQARTKGPTATKVLVLAKAHKAQTR